MLSYRGEVAEGSQTNVFLIEGRTVRTPTVEVGILAGITRELVLSLARELGFQTEESAFPPTELYRANEVFITSSTREVVPVVRIDETTIGTGRPGEVTLALLEAYRKRVAS
jgi:branched-chain amino acid aminotransferase